MPSVHSPILLGDTDVSRIQPLPCDRWIARSCLQKAIRRGEADVSVRALANLFLHEPNAVWRHLTVIALEDIGVANMDALEGLVSAKSMHQARRTPGLLWETFVKLTVQLAASEHCQATCDLLLSVENDSSLSAQRDQLFEAGSPRWAGVLYDPSAAITQKAIAAMCFGGFISTALSADPSAVFEICSENPVHSEVADLARSAWKLSRNPMALLLPLVWQRSRDWSDPVTTNDWVQPTELIHGVPEYAFDQFTRTGRAAGRALCEGELELQCILEAAGIARSAWSQVTGDLIFLVEGGACTRRRTWKEAETLRYPARWMPSTAILGTELQPAIKCIASKRRQLHECRRQLFHPPR